MSKNAETIIEHQNKNKLRLSSIVMCVLIIFFVGFFILCSCNNDSGNGDIDDFDAIKFYQSNVVEILSVGGFGTTNVGTGVIISGDDYPIIATNLHVAGKEGAMIAVKFYGETNFVNMNTISNKNVIEVLAYDEALDLCLFKVDYKPLVRYNILTAKIEDSNIFPFCEENIAINGTKVFSLGNSYGEGIIKFEGEIISKEEIVDTEFGLLPLIQTTLATTNGCSGGAMFDNQGRLLGLTSVEGGGQWGDNCNFSTPAVFVYRMYQEIFANESNIDM